MKGERISGVCLRRGGANLWGMSFPAGGGTSGGESLDWRISSIPIPPKVHENSSTFWVVLLTDRQTERQTNTQRQKRNILEERNEAVMVNEQQTSAQTGKHDRNVGCCCSCSPLPLPFSCTSQHSIDASSISVSAGSICTSRDVLDFTSSTVH